MLVSFTFISKIIERSHAGLNFNLFIANCILKGFAIKCNRLLLIANGFHRAVIEFLESRWDHDFDCGHRRKFWLMNATKGGSKKTSLNLCALFVTDIIESVIFQEVGVEDLVAVLLVNVPSIVDFVWTFHSHAELVFTIYVINGFQLWVTQNFVSLTNFVEGLKMDFHMSSIFERMVLKGKFFEICRDFLVSCASLNLEDFVKVSGCHIFYF